MNDNIEMPEDKAWREDLTKAAIEHQELQSKKHRLRNAENNTGEAIRRRIDTDPWTGE